MPNGAYLLSLIVGSGIDKRLYADLSSDMPTRRTLNSHYLNGEPILPDGYFKVVLSDYSCGRPIFVHHPAMPLVQDTYNPAILQDIVNENFVGPLLPEIGLELPESDDSAKPMTWREFRESQWRLYNQVDQRISRDLFGLPPEEPEQTHTADELVIDPQAEYWRLRDLFPGRMDIGGSKLNPLDVRLLQQWLPGTALVKIGDRTVPFFPPEKSTAAKYLDYLRYFNDENFIGPRQPKD